MLHKHHIVPRHMGGSDDPSNLVELTVEEHAEAHRKLYEEHGLKEDYIAWKALDGQITAVEATQEARKLWVENNPELSKEISRKATKAQLVSRANNPERFKNVNLKYRQENPEKHKESLLKAQNAVKVKIQTPEGCFNSMKEAADHYGLKVDTIRWRVNNNSKGFFRIQGELNG